MEIFTENVYIIVANLLIGTVLLTISYKKGGLT